MDVRKAGSPPRVVGYATPFDSNRNAPAQTDPGQQVATLDQHTLFMGIPSHIDPATLQRHQQMLGQLQQPPGAHTWDRAQPPSGWYRQSLFQQMPAQQMPLQYAAGHPMWNPTSSPGLQLQWPPHQAQAWPGGISASRQAYSHSDTGLKRTWEPGEAGDVRQPPHKVQKTAISTDARHSLYTQHDAAFGSQARLAQAALQPHPKIGLPCGPYHFEDRSGRSCVVHWSRYPQLEIEGERNKRLSPNALQMLGALIEAQIEHPGQAIDNQKLYDKLLKRNLDEVLSLSSCRAARGELSDLFGRTVIELVSKGSRLVPHVRGPATPELLARTRHVQLPPEPHPNIDLPCGDYRFLDAMNRTCLLNWSKSPRLSVDGVPGQIELGGVQLLGALIAEQIQRPDTPIGNDLLRRKLLRGRVGKEDELSTNRFVDLRRALVDLMGKGAIKTAKNKTWLHLRIEGPPTAEPSAITHSVQAQPWPMAFEPPPSGNMPELSTNAASISSRRSSTGIARTATKATPGRKPDLKTICTTQPS